MQLVWGGGRNIIINLGEGAKQFFPALESDMEDCPTRGSLLFV